MELDSNTHSVCERCSTLYAPYGHVYSGVSATPTECCFCGHPHHDALWITLDARPCDICAEKGQNDACLVCKGTGTIQMYPWWCSRKLGIHRGPRVEVTHG